MAQTHHIRNARALKSHSKLKLRAQPPQDPQNENQPQNQDPAPCSQERLDPHDPHEEDHSQSDSESDNDEFLLTELARLRQERLEQEQQGSKSSSLKRATSWRQSRVKRATSTSLIIGKQKARKDDFLDKFVR